MIDDAAAAAAESIWTAWRTGERLAELPAEIRPADNLAGMAAQLALQEHAGSAYGWKLAATTPAGQAHIGVDGPLPGLLFERFRYESGAVLASAHMHMRVAEAEFAFLMGADVEPGATAEDVLAAVATMHLAVEVPDSRFDRFDLVGAAQLLADCACAGRFVLGPAVPGWRELELSTWPTALWMNGEQAATGSGGAVLGDPRTALAWLAADLPQYGRTLRAGELVTTGTTTPPLPIGPGDRIRADFGELGEVTLEIAR